MLSIRLLPLALTVLSSLAIAQSTQPYNLPKIAATPPMGLNSWNWFAEKVPTRTCVRRPTCSRPSTCATRGTSMSTLTTYGKASETLALLCHKFQVPQKGQRQSFWSRERASKMRNVAMEYGLCRCGRMRASGLEVGRDLGSW